MLSVLIKTNKSFGKLTLCYDLIDLKIWSNESADVAVDCE